MTPQERERYEALVTEFRRLVNGIPRWDVREGPDGQPQIVDSLFETEIFRPCGPWAPNLVRYFEHVRHDPLLKLLALLDAASGPDTRRSALDFLESLRLLPPPSLRPNRG
ncbi:hypothetical protein Lesp01_49560 [Lentzea sp. NBRC 102530]|nr:hypothetical protein Lesp01_49560 [Lentzea sp. NBRC 102530]